MLTNEKIALLKRIAVQRVEGRSWTEIAQELKQSVEEVRALVWENEGLIDRSCGELEANF